MRCISVQIDHIRIPETHIREVTDAATLTGLADSLNLVGMLQPLVVREGAEDYELVTGLRRLMAARIAGMDCVPALIMPSDNDTLQIQLIENLQRADLNPVERAEAVRAYMKINGFTKAAAARKLGIPRTTLTEWLNLLDVPYRFRREVVDNFRGGDSPLTTSHISEALGLARRLNSPAMAEVLLEAVLQHKLSKAEVRHVARIVRQQRDVSIDEAIIAVRGPYSDDEAADHPDVADPDLLWPHENNMKQLVFQLTRSTNTLERMNHLSGRFLQQEEIEQLIDHYTTIKQLSERALARLKMEDPELLQQVQQQRAMEQRAANKKKRNKPRVRVS